MAEKNLLLENLEEGIQNLAKKTSVNDLNLPKCVVSQRKFTLFIFTLLTFLSNAIAQYLANIL